MLINVIHIVDNAVRWQFISWFRKLKVSVLCSNDLDVSERLCIFKFFRSRISNIGAGYMSRFWH